MPVGGTGTGAQAAAAAKQFASQVRSAIRKQRDGAAKTTHLMVKNYGMLPSGILIGLSDDLRGEGVQAKQTTTKPKKAACACPRGGPEPRSGFGQLLAGSRAAFFGFVVDADA
jgi:hypothetical protein